MNWRIGEVEIIQIIEMEGGELIQSFIPNATPENIKSIPWLFSHFANEKGHLKALVQSFLVKSKGKNILIDTCNGNEKTRPESPTWGSLHTDFLKRLNETGVNASDIDIVICTHFHFDHIGWNTRKENSAYIPTFPNAKYLFVEEEYRYWKQKPEKELEDDKLAFEDSITPIVNAGLSQFVQSDHKVDDNVSLMSTPGHTPGHVSVCIESKEKKAIISGDLLHHPCQIAHPEWSIDFDTVPEKALETRKNMLNILADTQTLLIGSHFANPVAGRIVRSDSGFIFVTS